MKYRSKMLRACLLLAAFFVVMAGGAVTLSADDTTKPAPAPAAAPAGDGNVMAVINGEKVDRDTLVKRLIDRYGSDELQQLIVDTVVNQEQKKYGVEVSDAEADAALQRNIQSQIDNLKSEILQQYRGIVTWDQYLQQTGTTEAQMREKLKKQMMAEKDADTILRRQVMLSKLAWYNYLTHTRYEVAHISVESEAEAKDVIKSLNEGKDFGDIAQAQSRDQKSATNGGRLQMAFSEGDYKFREDIPGPEFEHAVMALKPNDVSAPVKTNAGWDVIKLISKEDAKPGDYKTLEPEIIKRLSDPATNDVIGVYVRRLIRDAQIDNKSGLKLPDIENLKAKAEGKANPAEEKPEAPAEKPADKPAAPADKPAAEPAAPAPQNSAPTDKGAAPEAGGAPAVPESHP